MLDIQQCSRAMVEFEREVNSEANQYHEKAAVKGWSNGIISEKPNKNEIKQPIETEERTINTINNLINKKTNKLIN